MVIIQRQIDTHICTVCSVSFHFLLLSEATGLKLFYKLYPHTYPDDTSLAYSSHPSPPPLLKFLVFTRQAGDHHPSDSVRSGLSSLTLSLTPPLVK